MCFFPGFLFFHYMFIVSSKASFLSQKASIFISKLHEHKFIFLLYLKKLRFLPLSLLMWFWCASFSLPVFYVFFFLPLYLHLYAFFFCFLFFHCMFIVSSKTTFFSPKNFDFWVLTVQNIDFFFSAYLTVVEYCSSFAFDVSFVLSLLCFVSSHSEKDLIFCCSWTMLTFLVFLNILHYSSFSLQEKVSFSLLSFILSILVYNLYFVVLFGVCLFIYYIHS